MAFLCFYNMQRFAFRLDLLKCAVRIDLNPSNISVKRIIVSELFNYMIALVNHKTLKESRKAVQTPLVYMYSAPVDERTINLASEATTALPCLSSFLLFLRRQRNISNFYRFYFPMYVYYPDYFL